MNIKTVTVGELRTKLEYLLALPDSTEITFGNGDLSFSTLNVTDYQDPEQRTRPKRLQFEFAELYEVLPDATR